MIILGIETSCDETACAIVEDGVKIISSFVASSQELHEATLGIVPEVAAREQIKHILTIITLNFTLSGLDWSQIDGVAVTTGPGLIGSLLVGVETARTLSFSLNKPLIPINHVYAHLYGAFLTDTKPKFPATGLIVSGGHTELLLLKNHGDYVRLGGTRDDALGEAFDKVAKILDLGYPGGPAIEKLALEGNPKAIKFPRPMINYDDYDFSYSGLKTAVVHEFQKNPNISKADLAASFQEAALDVVVTKAMRAVEKYNVKSLIVAGGVAANGRLREMCENKISSSVTLHTPSPALCTDNAVIIASCAFFNNNPVPWQEVKADPSLKL